MLGVEDYGSGSDSDSPKLPILTKPKKPKKTLIALPALPSTSAVGQTSESEDGPRATKRQRLDAGAGSSSLLSMLPQPKQKTPARVLGGGSGQALAFSANPIAVQTAPKTQDAVPAQLAPSSIRKGKTNVSLEEGKPKPKPTVAASKPVVPAVDFFSLVPTTQKPSFSQSASQPSIAISSAPEVHTFEPPPPTQDDPYPGYYELPQGGYAAYDPAYYKSFHEKWTKDYNAQIRALERGVGRGFEAYDETEAEEVDLTGEIAKRRQEIQERERAKALTQPGVPKDDGEDEDKEKPNMNVQGAKLGRVARNRHQLTTLLTDAYANREMLEEKIAQGKRNRKEAGNKYGF